jgi:hypothetical protein
LLGALAALQFIPIVLEKRAQMRGEEDAKQGRATVDEAVRADKARRMIGD